MTSFEAIFLNFRDTLLVITEEVQMVDIGSRTLQTLIDFCYTGEITIADVNVQSILPAACLLQLNEIQVVLKFPLVINYVENAFQMCEMDRLDDSFWVFN